MKAFLRNIILIGHDGTVKDLGFERGLNIITGDSKTGKSALIEIVDYCLFSKRSTIPVGIVTDFTDIFCCVFEHNNKKIVIGRSNRQPTKCYFAVEYSVDFIADNIINANYFKSKKTRSRLEVQKDFEEHLGLSVEDTSLTENDYNLNKGKVSIRNATSLFFQHQNLIANKHSLFCRFDNFIKSRSVIDQFPIFMGWVDSRYYRLKKRSEELEKQIKKIDKEEKKTQLDIQEKREKLLIPIREYYRILNLKFLDEDASLDKLKYLARNLPFVPLNAEQNVDFNKQLNSLEKKKDKELTSLYECNQLISLIKSNEEESIDYSNSMERLKEISQDEFESKHNVSCPLCNAPVSNVVARVEEVKHSRMLLLDELSRINSYKQDSSKSLNSLLLKRDKQKQVIANIENEMKQLRKLYKVKNNLDIRDSLNIIRGRIESSLEIFIEGQSSEKANHYLSELREELEICDEQIRGYGLEHKFSEANALINQTMNELKKDLDFEDDLRDGEMKFKTEDFTFTYYFKKQEILLSEMGSGANWLACHLAVFLSILKLTSSSHSVIPAFLFLDQPSQVYFPKVTRRFSSINKEELSNEDGVDEDIKQVINIFKVIERFLDKLEEDPNVGFKPQIIVLEHADQPEFNKYIRYRWSSNGSKLI
ncbi:DUF3732 domain-containing protein [Photobacterium damselae]|uniref:Rad50/SbcC-type AAA domain-containing protein n=2 Tax=Photobacterium damselae TaxID=38293 RepID=D0YZB2_PHODD|nr:DUF3732 domain-containing protein [Photobacterium damselae]EEZ41593.1 hypothetical protein VDA_002625 [Photobacterium damselae subsp. damselae CIP 102761]PSW87334.1 DUF3732 domain-containing protein [Photobacterium damselae]SPY27575.1 Protein of uncharacterised function (DUF3732) [Photobacterium damselae]